MTMNTTILKGTAFISMKKDIFGQAQRWEDGKIGPDKGSISNAKDGTKMFLSSDGEDQSGQTQCSVPV